MMKKNKQKRKQFAKELQQHTTYIYAILKETNLINTLPLDTLKTLAELAKKRKRQVNKLKNRLDK